MSTQPLKIFVVDDEPMARMIPAFAFDGPGYEVFEFASGRQCLAALDKKPDVILMDIEMPEMDGISACQALRKAGETAAQVIFLSGHNDLETRMKAYDAGGNDYLVKPYEPEEVLRKILNSQQISAQARHLSDQARHAKKTASAALSAVGEFAVVTRFLRASYAAMTSREVADDVFGALKQLGLTGLVAVHSPATNYSACEQGACSPLELSILAHARDMGPVFQVRDRLIVNARRFTLVAFNLPLDDPDCVARLYDHLIALVEGANARLAAIVSEHIRASQSAGIAEAMDELTLALDAIAAPPQPQREWVQDTLNDYLRALENCFSDFGLHPDQEKTMRDMASEMVEKMAEKLGCLLPDDNKLSKHLLAASRHLEPLGAVGSPTG